MEFDNWIEDSVYGKPRNQGIEIAMREAWNAGIAHERQRISGQLRKAGATLPAPAATGTIEGAMNHGLCIALVVVENPAPDGYGEE